MVNLSTLKITSKARLLVIDAQNDVCEDNSAYAVSEYAPGKKRDVKPIQQAVEEGLLPFLERARSYGLPVGFIQSVYHKGQYSYSGISDKWLTIDPELEDAEWRIKIYRDMPESGEPIFRKDTQETFLYEEKENGLADWLRETELVLVGGFTTDGCVKKGVYALLSRNYEPVVLKDCVATSGHKINTAHEAALNEFKNHKSVRIIDSKKVIFRAQTKNKQSN